MSEPNVVDIAIVEDMSCEQARDVMSAILSGLDEGTSEDFEIIKTVVETFPALAGEKIFLSTEHHKSDEKDFPLVALVTKRIGSTWKEHMILLKLVYDAFPSAIDSWTSDGRVVVHRVCESDMHVDVIAFLLDKNPRSAFAVDIHDKWPKVWNFMDHSSIYSVVVETLIDAFAKRDELNLIQNGAELPPPLLLAFGMRIQRLGLLEQIIVAQPSCTRISLNSGNIAELELELITPEIAELLARRIAPWMQDLSFDSDIMFTPESLSAFLSALSLANPVALNIIDFTISTALLELPSSLCILCNFSQLLHRSQNLTSIDIRFSNESSDESLSHDLFLHAIAKGLGEHHPIQKLELRSIHRPTFAGLSSILARCRNLESVRVSLTTLTREGAASIAHGISQSRSLKAIDFQFSGDLSTSAANTVIGAIADSLTVESLVLGSFKSKASTLPFPGLAKLTNLKSLRISFAQANNLQTSNAILDLLKSSNNLVELTVGYISLPPKRTCKILKMNTILEKLSVWYHPQASELGKGILQVLRDSNSTLRFAEIGDKDGEELWGSLQDQLEHYLALNRAGRASILNAETSTVSDVVEVLEGLIGDESRHEVVAVSIYYGLLRESPSLWSIEHHGVTVEGDVRDVSNAVDKFDDGSRNDVGDYSNEDSVKDGAEVL